MKIAVIGSRNVTVDHLGEYLEEYLEDCEEIVSGGAIGVDTIAANYAKENGLLLTVFLPEYGRYGRAAPILRNQKIVDYADQILAFWDGRSKGTRSVIKYAEKTGKPCKIIFCKSLAE